MVKDSLCADFFGKKGCASYMFHMTKWDEGNAVWEDALGAHVYATSFGFCGILHYVADSVAHNFHGRDGYDICYLGGVIAKNLPCGEVNFVFW